LAIPRDHLVRIAGKAAMGSFKNAWGIITGLIPVVYCVGFLIYFANVERFTGVPVGNQLGPTVLGLGVVALLFSIPVILRIARLLRAPPTSKDEARRTAEVFADSPSDFDADAAIARYMAQRQAAEAASASLPDDGAPPQAPRRGFGRKRS
jgi:hypothetical protein